MTIARIPAWRAPLSVAIEAARRRPFQWGAHDCATFAADCILAMTGTDLMAPWRGLYGSPTGALRLIREAGHESYAAMIATSLPEIPEGQARARIGDLVLFATDDAIGTAAGILIGERANVLRPEGVATISRLAAIRAFRVG